MHDYFISCLVSLSLSLSRHIREVSEIIFSSYWVFSGLQYQKRFSEAATSENPSIKYIKTVGTRHPVYNDRKSNDILRLLLFFKFGLSRCRERAWRKCSASINDSEGESKSFFSLGFFARLVSASPPFHDRKRAANRTATLVRIISRIFTARNSSSPYFLPRSFTPRAFTPWDRDKEGGVATIKRSSGVRSRRASRTACQCCSRSGSSWFGIAPTTTIIDKHANAAPVASPRARGKKPGSTRFEGITSS